MIIGRIIGFLGWLGRVPRSLARQQRISRTCTRAHGARSKKNRVEFLARRREKRRALFHSAELADRRQTLVILSPSPSHLSFSLLSFQRDGRSYVFATAAASLCSPSRVSWFINRKRRDFTRRNPTGCVFPRAPARSHETPRFPMIGRNPIKPLRLIGPS